MIKTIILGGLIASMLGGLTWCTKSPSIPDYQKPPTEAEIRNPPPIQKSRPPTDLEKQLIDKYLKKHPQPPNTQRNLPSPSKNSPRPQALPQNSTVFVAYEQNGQVGAFGSGFLVSADGIIVTAAHVAELGTRGPLTVQIPHGKKYTATVLDINKRYDIAVLKIQQLSDSLPYIKVNRGIPQKGSAATIWGYSDWQLRPKHVTFIKMIQASGPQQFDLEFSAGVKSGDSGGPIVDTQNEAIGVAVAVDVINKHSYGVNIANLQKIVCKALQNELGGTGQFRCS